MTTNRELDRKDFLKKAGVGTVAAASIPLLASEAFAQPHPGTGRSYFLVSFSQAPTSRHVQPRMNMFGCGNFNETLRTVTGGGGYVLLDNAPPVPKPLISSGKWRPVAFVSWDTKGLPSYGTIQPGILTALVDVEGIGTGLEWEFVCNVGPAGLSTGKDEGWTLKNTPSYGTFTPVVPALGLTATTIPGFSVG